MVNRGNCSLVCHGHPCSRRGGTTKVTTGVRPSISRTHERHLVVFVVLLVIPTVGLDSVARDHLHRHITRVNIHQTFNSAELRLVKRVVTRGLIIALLTKIVKLLLDMTFTCLKGALLFTRRFDRALDPPTISTDVLLRNSAFN